MEVHVWRTCARVPHADVSPRGISGAELLVARWHRHLSDSFEMRSPTCTSSSEWRHATGGGAHALSTNNLGGSTPPLRSTARGSSCGAPLCWVATAVVQRGLVFRFVDVSAARAQRAHLGSDRPAPAHRNRPSLLRMSRDHSGGARRVLKRRASRLFMSFPHFSRPARPPHRRSAAEEVVNHHHAPRRGGRYYYLRCSLLPLMIIDYSTTTTTVPSRAPAAGLLRRGCNAARIRF